MHTEINEMSNGVFQFNNEHRKYFGLNPIEDHWEKVELDKGVFLYFYGDIIKKIIILHPNSILNYREIDNEVHTQNREMILPKTNRGKAKRLTTARLTHLIPTGCEFWVIVSENGLSITTENRRNEKQLPIIRALNIKTVNELYVWLDEYMRTCPSDYFGKVEEMKNSPHITVKYQAGDIFRFELDRENYGFGIIIGEIRKLQKEGIITEKNPIRDIPAIPLLLRLYILKKSDKDISIEDISKHELLPIDIVMDNDIIWGKHEIIGSKDLEETDIDFPIQVVLEYPKYPEKARMTDKIRYLIVPPHAWLYWGTAYIEIKDMIKRTEINRILVENREQMGCSIRCGVGICDIEEALKGKRDFSGNDLRSAKNVSLKEKIFALFDVPQDIDFDKFARENHGITRKEFAEHINKTRKHIKKRY